MKRKSLYSPDALDAVFPKDRVGRDDRTILLEGLSGEQAVEWITVVEWQRRNPCHVTKIDRELPKRVGRKVLRDESFDRTR
jgi:hypothetical protein